MGESYGREHHFLSKDRHQAFDEFFVRTSDVTAEVLVRHEEAVRQVFGRTHRHDMVHDPPSAAASRSESLVRSDSEVEINVDKAVEIEFDRSDKKAPEEWKIFFEGNTDEDSASSAVMIDGPVADNVISISSDDSDDTFTECDEENGDDNDNDDNNDDDSWAMLDGE